MTLVALFSGKCKESLLRNASQGFSEVARWMHDNGLVLNMAKTKFSILGTLANSDDIETLKVHEISCSRELCSCAVTQRVGLPNNLGLTVQEDGKFDKHVSYVISKVRSGIAVLYRLRYVGTISFRKSLYSALVESHIRYMIPIYGGSFTSTIDPLPRLQKKAIRLVCNARRDQHSRPLFEITSVSSFIKLYSTCLCAMMSSEMEVMSRPAHRHDTRFARYHKLSIPITKTSVSYKSARVYYVKLYNSFPLQKPWKLPQKKLETEEDVEAVHQWPSRRRSSRPPLGFSDVFSSIVSHVMPLSSLLHSFSLRTCADRAATWHESPPKYLCNATSSQSQRGRKPIAGDTLTAIDSLLGSINVPFI